MRNFIIGLSVLFLSLSGIITFKALEIPAEDTRYQNNLKVVKSKDLSPKSEDVSGQLAKEQAANRALVEKLQATIATLEDKLSNKIEETQANVETERSKKTARVLAVFGDGAFRTGQVVINKGLMNAVKESVRDILASPDYRVIIEGHTDNMPIKLSSGKQYRDNLDLSFLRAKAIANILVKYGISRERISVIGYGDTRPIASNETNEGRAKNRRVEVKLIPEDKEF
ncbi:MAG TPA: OmpA family protein [Nitrospirae bacterium]|nr:peptidoglycan-binding protein ArfA [bacterium BMS3Abin06]HDH12634.1 OmpA family protein [Nitrospirota bacterium]HDZ02666.1 OmpA family protein [Nitrospirota bacterium]